MKVQEPETILLPFGTLFWKVIGEFIINPLKQKTMGVQLREKKLGNGKISFYLDIYHNKTRWYEFLDIHINKNRLSEDDKEKKRLANEIKVKRQNELIVKDNGLIDRSKRKADFVVWYEKYIADRGLKYDNNTSALIHVKNYQDGKPLPFASFTPEWIKGFGKYLVGKVSPNSAINYIKKMITAMAVAVEQGIILQNPFHQVPRKDRIKRKPTFRHSYSLDDLQVLYDTPCKVEQYKQAYLFACFTGLRWSDVNPLRWSEIILKTIDSKQEWFMHFEQEKTEDIEYLPISEQAILILKERKKEQSDSGIASLYVFPLVKESDTEKRTTEKRVNYNLKQWAKAAGFDLKKMHFHSSRHTFATNILENSPDGDLWTVSKLLGHKSISATQIYAQVRDSRKKSAVDSLPKLNTKLSVG